MTISGLLIIQSGPGGSGSGIFIGLSTTNIGSIGFILILFLHLPIGDEVLHYIPLEPVKDATVLIEVVVYWTYPVCKVKSLSSNYAVPVLSEQAKAIIYYPTVGTPGPQLAESWNPAMVTVLPDIQPL